LGSSFGSFVKDLSSFLVLGFPALRLEDFAGFKGASSSSLISSLFVFWLFLVFFGFKGVTFSSSISSLFGF
jgi:hypothetical protein